MRSSCKTIVLFIIIQTTTLVLSQSTSSSPTLTPTSSPKNSYQPIAVQDRNPIRIISHNEFMKLTNQNKQQSNLIATNHIDRTQSASTESLQLDVPAMQFLMQQQQQQNLSQSTDPIEQNNVDCQQKQRNKPPTAGTKSKISQEQEQLEQFVLSLKPNLTTSTTSQDVQQQFDESNSLLADDLMLEQEIEMEDLLKQHQSQNGNFEHRTGSYSALDQGTKGGHTGGGYASSNTGFNRYGPTNLAVSDAPRVKAAVLTRYSMEVRPVDTNILEQQTEEDGEPMERIIEVIPKGRPIQIHFKSPMSRLKVIQLPYEKRESQEPEVERSEEEPTKIFQHIKKPIIQEVHEIIMPFRKVIQEIQPVVEQIHTVVSSSSRSGPTVQPHPSPPTKTSPSSTASRLSGPKNYLEQHLVDAAFSQQNREREDESATLSPLLMGVEQQVEPMQHPPIPLPPPPSSMPSQKRRVRKYVMSPSLMSPMMVIQQQQQRYLADATGKQHTFHLPIQQIKRTSPMQISATSAISRRNSRVTRSNKSHSLRELKL